jgi:FeS assembly protein IscX
MPATLTWDDFEKIGILLSKKYPELYPLSATLEDLHRCVIALTEFEGDSKLFDKHKLEAIREAWNNEFLDRTK